jgi:hypothetical protein
MLRHASLAAALAFALAASAPAAPEPPPLLAKSRQAVEASLKKIDAALAKSAATLAKSGIENPAARRALADLYKACPNVIDVCTVSPDGKMTLVEPAPYRKFEGFDISSQEQVRRVRESKKPALSRLFKSVEGIYALDFEHPVLSDKGEFLGSVSVLFRPDALFGPALAALYKDTGYEAFILQYDGLLLSDPDPAQVGKSVIEDPMYKPYPQVAALGKRMAEEPAGYGTYEFTSPTAKKAVTKEAHWATLEFAGAEWRIALYREIADTKK